MTDIKDKEIGSIIESSLSEIYLLLVRLVKVYMDCSFAVTRERSYVCDISTNDGPYNEFARPITYFAACLLVLIGLTTVAVNIIPYPELGAAQEAAISDLPVVAFISESLATQNVIRLILIVVPFIIFVALQSNVMSYFYSKLAQPIDSGRIKRINFYLFGTNFINAGWYVILSLSFYHLALWPHLSVLVVLPLVFLSSISLGLCLSLELRKLWIFLLIFTVAFFAMILASLIAFAALVPFWSLVLEKGL